MVEFSEDLQKVIEIFVPDKAIATSVVVIVEFLAPNEVDPSYETITGDGQQYSQTIGLIEMAKLDLYHQLKEGRDAEEG